MLLQQDGLRVEVWWAADSTNVELVARIARYHVGRLGRGRVLALLNVRNVRLTSRRLLVEVELPKLLQRRTMRGVREVRTREGNAAGRDREQSRRVGAGRGGPRSEKSPVEPRSWGLGGEWQTGAPR